MRAVCVVLLLALACCAALQSASAQTLTACSLDSPCTNPSQTCVVGFCVAINALPQLCSPFFPCTDSSRTCFGGYCLQSSAVPARCTDATPCTDTNLVCTQVNGVGYCLASGAGASVTTKSCAVNADCLVSSPRCDPTTRTCVPYFAPTQDCKSATTGASLCASDEQCLVGLCVKQFPATTCSPACNTANGEKCSAFTNLCIIAATPVCANCATGRCVSSPFPGADPLCLAPVSAITCLRAQDCPGNTATLTNVCVQGSCVACGPICAALSSALSPNDRDLLLAELSAGGGLSASYTNVQLAAAVTATINAKPDGILAAVAGSLLQLDATATNLRGLLFAAADASAARVGDGAALTIASVNATSTRGQLLIASGSSLAANSVQIANGGLLTLSMGAAGSGISGLPAVVRVAQLNLQGKLNVYGDDSNSFIFPAVGTSSTASGAGAVQAAGGVSLQGNAGSVPINIAGSQSASATVSADARASVAAGQFLATQGSVLGTAARLVVRGTVAFAGRVVEPQIQIIDGGLASFQSLDVAATTGGVVGTYAGNVTFNSNPDDGIRLWLVVNGTMTSGKNMYFGTLTNCPEDATIRFILQSGSVATALRTGFVLFKYAVPTFSLASGFQCAIEVCDRSNICINVQNPNNYATSNPGRRLLQAAAGTASASWEPSQLSVSQTAGGGQASSASQASLSAFFVAMLAVVAVLSRGL